MILRIKFLFKKTDEKYNNPNAIFIYLQYFANFYQLSIERELHVCLYYHERPSDKESYVIYFSQMSL